MRSLEIATTTNEDSPMEEKSGSIMTIGELSGYLKIPLSHSIS